MFFLVSVMFVSFLVNFLCLIEIFQRTTSGSFSLYGLYCIGDYAEVVVIDPQDMNILFTLSLRVESDWISAFAVISYSSKQGMNVL